LYTSPRYPVRELSKYTYTVKRWRNSASGLLLRRTTGRAALPASLPMRNPDPFFNIRALNSLKPHSNEVKKALKSSETILLKFELSFTVSS